MQERRGGVGFERRGGRLVLGYRPSEDASFARDFPAEIYAIRPVAEVERLVTELYQTPKPVADKAADIIRSK